MLLLRFHGMTYKSIGNKYNLSQERIRQIVHKQERLSFRRALKTLQEFTRAMKRVRAVRNNADVNQVQILHSMSDLIKPMADIDAVAL